MIKKLLNTKVKLWEALLWAASTALCELHNEGIWKLMCILPVAYIVLRLILEYLKWNSKAN